MSISNNILPCAQINWLLSVPPIWKKKIQTSTHSQLAYSNPLQFFFIKKKKNLCPHQQHSLIIFWSRPYVNSGRVIKNEQTVVKIVVNQEGEVVHDNNPKDSCFIFINWDFLDWVVWVMLEINTNSLVSRNF